MAKNKGSAEALFDELRQVRDNFLYRAEKCAALTLPMLVPRNGETRVGNIRNFPTPRQGIGARGVNHLSSRILLSLLPPQAPFFKFDLDVFARQALSQGTAEIEAQVEATLRAMEDSIQRIVNVEAMRVSAIELIKHLIVSGNACMYFPEKGGLGFYPLSQYVCVRDPEGDEVIDFVLKECVDYRALPKDIQKLVVTLNGRDNTNYTAPTGNQPVEIFSRQTLIEPGKYKFYQEISGVTIPDTYGIYKEEDIMYRPLRWTKVQGEAYGRGMIEEYLGDLVALEGLAQALVEGALGAARLVGLIRPNSQTRAQDLNDAKNGEFVFGIEDDVKFLQVQKQGDFGTAFQVANGIEKRLEQAFMLNSGIIRDAERVTAEEVRFVAQELESTLGGVYTVLAHEFQLPLVRSIYSRLTRKRLMPPIPGPLKNSIKPVIITGTDALGRNAELDRLRQAMGTISEIVGPQSLAQAVHLGALATFIFERAGVTAPGLLKTDAEMAQEAQAAQQAQAQQELVSKGVGPAVNAVSAATQAQAQPAQ